MRATLRNLFRKTFFLSILSLFATTTTSALDVVAANNDATEILPSSTIEAIGTYFKVFERSVTTTDLLHAANEITTVSVSDYEALELVARLRTSYDVGDVDCNGGNNGYATVYVTGGTAPYTYQWSHGATTQTIENLVAGMYRLVIEDADGNRANCRVRIKEPSRLTHNITKLSDASAYGASDGSARVRVNGGTRPYSYAWDNGETTDTAYSLDAGNHRVDITDANGCTTVCYIQINEPEPEPEDCKVAGDDCAITVCEGTQPSEQQLFDALLGEDAGGIWSGPVNGVYTYTIAAAGTCPEDSATVTVTEEDALSAGVSTDLALCDSDDDPTMTELLALLGGDAGGSWDPGAYAGAGDYTYTIAATATCEESSATVSVTVSTALSAGTSTDLALCDSDDDPTMAELLALLGGDAGGTWSPSAYAGAGDYTYTIAATATCEESSATVSVTVSTALSAGTSTDLALCDSDDDPTMTELLALLGGDAGGSWDPGAYAGAGDYTYTIAATATCEESSATVSVTVSTALSAGTSTDLALCDSDDDPTMAELLALLGGDAGGTWSPSAYAGAGDYTYTIAATATCEESSATVSVTVSTALSAGTSTDLALCDSDDDPTMAELLALLGGDAGGTWSPSAYAGAGDYTYTIAATATCEESSATVSVTVSTALSAGTSTDLALCDSDDDPTMAELLALLGGDAGGTWSPSAYAGAGDYTYTIAATATCEESSATVSVTVSTALSAGTSTDLALCDSDDDPTMAELLALLGGDAGGTWSPSAYAGAGDYTYTIAATATCEESSATVSVTVSTALSAGTSTDLALCDSDDDPTMAELLALLNGDAGGSWDPGAYAGAGDYTYTIAATATCEESSATVSVTVSTALSAGTSTDLALCDSDDDPTMAELLALLGGDAGGTWSPSAYAGAGDYTYTIAATATCEESSATVSVTVSTALSAGTSTDLALCDSDDDPTMAELLALLNGDAGGSWDPGAYAGAGDYTYTIAATATCEESSATVSVTVSTALSAGTSTDLALCDSDDDPTMAELLALLGGDAGGSWDPGAYAGAGDYTYTIAATATCEESSATVSVTVSTALSAGTSTDLALCDSDDDPTMAELLALLGGDAGGSWDPGAYAGAGDYTYTIAATATCEESSATVSVTVSTALSAGTSTDLALCDSDDDPTMAELLALLGGDAGGTWSPSAYAGAGDYTYTIAATATCEESSATVSVTVSTALSAGTSTDLALCDSDDDPTMAELLALLNGDAGGTWSPSAYAGAGDYTYTIAATATCEESSATVSVTVSTALSAGTSTDLALCDSDDDPTMAELLALLGGDAGGTWSPSAYAGAGDYTYTIAATATCEESSATVTITEEDAPNAGDDVSLCKEDDPPSEQQLFDALTGNPDEDGVWSGPVVDNDENDVYTYTVTSGDCEDTSTVTVTEDACCETAFARYDEGGDEDLIDETNDGRCFLDDGFNRWGWTNLFSAPGSYNLQLYSGAGQCGFANRQSGIVTVDWEGSSNMVTVRIDLLPGFEMQQAHLYVGGNDYPTVQQGPNTSETVAPGKYPYQDGEGGNPEITTPVTSYTFSPVDVSGLNEIYVIVHAVTCEVEICKSAGENGTLTICEGDDPNPTDEQLFAELSGADEGGTWTSNDAIYTYTIAATDNCPEVTSTVTVTYEDCNPCDFLTQLGQDIDGEATADWSGRSVSMSADGSIVAIGAHLNDGNGVYSGQVRIYEYSSGSGWTQLGADIDGEAAFDNSGNSVSVSADGSRVAIGAHGNDGNGISSGHVRIYAYNGSAWIQVGADIDGEAAFGASGWSVSMSADGSRVAIGAQLNDDGPGFDSGQVRIFEYDNTSDIWLQMGADINGEAANDRLGFSVSLSANGSRVAIGAIFNDDGPGFNSGQVRIYEYDSGSNSWSQLGADINGEGDNDQSGHSVSLSADGSRVAIGAPLNDGTGTDTGQVRIFEYNSGSASWSQLGGDIDGQDDNDWAGYSVSLSADGSRVALDARYNDDGPGDNSGQVRIFEYDSDSDSWSQQGGDILGEAAEDLSGYSVSLSADGSRVAIGATGNNANGSYSGHVRVYGCAAEEETAPTAVEKTSTTVVTVFKEPTKDVLSLDLDISYDATINVNFIDLSGRTVLTPKSREVNTGKNRLEYNMGVVPSQVLILNVYTGREILSKKVLFIK